VRRGGLWAKHMGLEQGVIGNTIGNLKNIKNLMGTRWELEENMLGTKKNEKNLPPNPPPKT
jgi:hypothetical protein